MYDVERCSGFGKRWELVSHSHETVADAMASLKSLDGDYYECRIRPSTLRLDLYVDRGRLAKSGG